METSHEEVSVIQETVAYSEPTVRLHRDWLGSLIGLTVFLGGIALLVLVFRLAYNLFTVPPAVALEIQQPGKPIDLSKTTNAASGVLIRFLLLLLMAGMGSLIANRGINLYGQSRSYKK
jgi:hypothetical protein